MLQRTVSRTEGGGGPSISWRPVVLAAVVLGIVAGGFWLLPTPGPRIRPSTLTEAELRERILTLRLADPTAASRADKKRAAFGAKLFADAGLSHDGKTACATCHVPAKSFTDGKRATSLVNAAQSVWFMADGRADSLAAAALLHLEDPNVHGVSRAFVTRYVKASYASDYEEAFGSFPAALKSTELPPQAMPAPTEVKLPIELSAYALSTLGSFPLMTDILKKAQAARLAPAVELAHRAVESPARDAAWTEAWKKLTPEEQQGVDVVFADVGKALAAYQQGLVATESAFDRFASRVAAGKLPSASLDTGFGAKELQGLELFVGAGGCGGCHAGAAFTDQKFHNIGLSQRGDHVDLGRAAVVAIKEPGPFTCFGTLLKPQDVGAWPVSCERPAWAELDLTSLVYAFKTPSLRNVGETAPYMHDGRFASLDDVLTYYSELGDKAAVGRRQEGMQRLDLTHEERQALLAFLGALTSPVRDSRTGQTLSAKP